MGLKLNFDHSQVSTDGLYGWSTELGRINVLLGANGSGKSRILRKLLENIQGSVTYIEGGRTVTPPENLELNVFGEYSTLVKADEAYKKQRRSTLGVRFKSALMLLIVRAKSIREEHSLLVQTWKKNGMKGDVPDPAQDPFEHLSELFTAVFPEISITLQEPSKELICKKKKLPPYAGNDYTYKAKDLSDGEKQVLSLLTDIVLTKVRRDSLFIVDEPELNLHPDLACRLWDTIENSREGSTFIYATHCLPFALRRSVEKLYVIHRENGPIEIPEIQSLSEEELKPFLGSLPGILYSAENVLVEGHENSFDAVFYNWLFKNNSILVSTIGSCENVVSAVKRINVWSAISSIRKFVGIVDRDYRSDGEIERLSKCGCIPLGLHEAESYLCIPQILSILVDKIGTAKISEKSITEKIKVFFKTEMLKIAVRRTNETIGIPNKYGLPREILAECCDEVKIRNALAEYLSGKQKEVIAKLSLDDVIRTFDKELLMLKSIERQDDVMKMLKYSPGKELIASLLPDIGVSSAEHLAKAASAHLAPDSFTELKGLRDLILETLKK